MFNPAVATNLSTLINPSDPIRLRIVDLHSMTAAPGWGGLSADNLHMKPVGYRSVAEKVFAVLSSTDSENQNESKDILYHVLPKRD